MGKRLNIRISNQDFREIEACAKKNGMSINAYVRHSALNPVIVIYNYRAVTDHLKEVKGIRDMLFPLVERILREESVYRIDIDRVISIMESLERSENELLKACRRDRESVKDTIMKVKQS